MRRIFYVTWIHCRGPLGIPCVKPVLRVAHVDEANWRRLRRKPFSMAALMGCRP